MTYSEFLQTKTTSAPAGGFHVDLAQLNPNAFEWQKAIIRWALKKGRCEMWEDCGMGKTLQQLDFARQVCQHESTNVIVFAPLSVAAQTQREGAKFEIPVNIIENQADIKKGINITNYEKLDKFDYKSFGGVVLDESSILKAYDGKTRDALTKRFHDTPYRLGCSATPAPNDYMEIGNHAEFLGIMSRTEMLSTFFVHDSGDTAKWRLKGHAADKFWEWIAGWAVVMQKPSDLGYPDDGYDLPPLNIHEHIVPTGELVDGDGQIMLLPKVRQTLNDRRAARRASLDQRVDVAAEIANSTNEQVLVWCDLNSESQLLARSIPDAVEVTGSDPDAHKVNAMMGFSSGSVRVLVSKPSIAGWGMNWQNCHKEIFVGLSDSYEAWYQALRRCWRFGQEYPVDAHMVISDAEGAVRENLRRKHADSQQMVKEMVRHTRDILTAEIRETTRASETYTAKTPILVPSWLGGKAG